MSVSELLYFNGINASTGDYLVPPLSAAQLAQVARGELIPPDQLPELKWRAERERAHWGPKEGVDPDDLAQTGWGVIFPVDADPGIRDALRPLLELRQAQANRIKERYREYSGANGVGPNDTKNQFLIRQKVGPGPVDPDKVPYYLLIVGDPEKIPYSFQAQLDVAYGVGRIHFDTPDEYAQYAESVVRAEKETSAQPHRAVLFGVRNPGDESTQATLERLIKPLAADLQANAGDWTLQGIMGEEATKSRLERVLGGDETPALLFTASHGVYFDLGDPRQVRHQGALVCSDWPGPMQTVTQKYYMAADDVSGDAHVSGLIAFHFACFGAGTPRLDEFGHLRQGARQQAQIAPSAFLAKLPRRLLSHPKGGALAVIGHVDRAWGSSFVLDPDTSQTEVFNSTLKRLLQGHPVGSATEFLNGRYAELATVLNSDLEQARYGKQLDPAVLASHWTAHNDARGYAVIGDPAVRLRVQDRGMDAAQSAAPIELTPSPAGAAAGSASSSDSGQIHARDAALAQAEERLERAQEELRLAQEQLTAARAAVAAALEEVRKFKE